ncbi:Zinc finger, MIZ-type [Corchorus olitorius]|uniref:Zinc finger, MIZ-type n=1 Tax=Corchorus olitorius TaxID=93759 RepID=A0A1R3KGE0_9ROSI|nr:Zinc finger, MIZ-type [Corchorus olitorius]
MTMMPPPSAAGMPGLGPGHQVSASVVNSFRVAAVAERLATHIQPGGPTQSSEGIDYAIANSEVPAKAQELPALLKKICQRRNDLFLQAAIMVLMISVKNACKMSWFSAKESQDLIALANEVGSCFGSCGYVNDSDSTIYAVMSRFYPLMKMGQILASLKAKPGYGALVIDFHIAKNTMHSPLEKIRLFVAQTDNIETSACIISPQQVNFLLNGKGVDRRTNVLMDTGPQMPTNVTSMLKYGTNLLQAVGQFSVVAFMSMESSSPDASVLLDYVQSGEVAPDSEDSDIIEGPSRISLKCPISRTRIKIPVKGKACKHLQCFDFNNYVDINTRRPSWRCPHCNQHVLKEVAEDVSHVIISADGSWKAVFDNDDNEDELRDKILNCEKDGSEQPESAKAIPMVVDLTHDGNEVDAMETEIEDIKPSVANLQSESAAPTTIPELMNTVGVNQNVASHLVDNFWSELYLGHGFGASSSRTDTPTVGTSESTPNFTVPPVFSDAVSSAANRTEAHGNAANRTNLGIQNQYPAVSNLQLQAINSAASHEYGRLQHIPRHINRTPIAVQALPAASPSPTATLQQRPRNSLNALSTNGSPLPQANSPANLHQSWNQQERPLVPSQSVQQVAGIAASSQLPGSYRGSSGLPTVNQNLQRQQALNPRSSQPRSPSPGLIRSPSPLLRTPTQQGAAQVGLGHTAGNNSIPTRFRPASQRPAQMARQSPMVAVQTQTPRPPSTYSATVDRSRVSAGERLNMGGLAPAASRADTSGDLASEDNWRPAGRMRGSLTGRAYSSALSQLMIQPTQSPQAARPQTNLSSPPARPQTNLTSPPARPQTNLASPSSAPGVSPHLQALLANSRNGSVPVPMIPVSVAQVQNNGTTETSGINGSSNIPPGSSSGMH